ncbi:MAG: Fic family protein [Aureispira sp.]
MKPPYKIERLPLSFDLETKAILKQAIKANKALAELKGVARTIPNESILVNTLILTEAKESSAIENIVTTHDELFKADVLQEKVMNLNTKEVMNYANALRQGFQLVRDNDLLINRYILAIQEELEGNVAGFRTQIGTTLKDGDGNVVYTPPQDAQEIERLMENLEQYINEDDLDDLDWLVKMAVIHFQFESIHPFYDGNGRTGRIINILYLCLKGLLDTPILYLSRFIIQNKAEYYSLLQAVRDHNKWEEWILYILKGVEQTALESIQIIKSIYNLMLKFKKEIRAKLPKIYSKDLLENLFKHPYTKIEFLQQDINKTRQTTASYLDELVSIGLMEKIKHGKSNYYINQELFALFAQ